MRVPTNSLEGAALDWAVAKCEGYSFTTDGVSQLIEKGDSLIILGRCTTGQGRKCGYSPSTDWSQGGPIIERKEIQLSSTPYSEGLWWYANCMGSDIIFSGPTPLVAAMRCYVESVFGETINVPEELLK